ncbi:MAG: GNAT family N-acetyltransferase [Anaerolineae bacterium]|nr:GNAT family N-acetyltransferase [Anaerolineae bacterium]
MNMQLRTPSRSDRNLVRRLMELYQYDFSEFDEQDLDEHGCFGYGDLDYFWFEPTHAVFPVTVDEKLAGFVLIDNEVVVTGNERSVTEFFIMRKYRRQGVGKQVAIEVFRRLPAKWEVRVIEKNAPAQAFWRRVIAEYTQNTFQEKRLDNDEWQGPVFYFDNHTGQ